MKTVVIGAGLGGLATALRLQGAGHDVTVVEARERPGGRAYQIQDGGFTWDTGPSLITMPWVLEETFAAGGLDFAREIELHELDPFYRIYWAGEDRHLDLVGDEDLMRQEIGKFSRRDADRFPAFMEHLRPIYEDGILDAGRREFSSPQQLLAFLPRMVRMGAVLPLYRTVAKYFENPRIREAFSFHSLFIGGDPYRVPSIYAALVYLQFLDRVWYATGGVYALIKAMAGPLDVRCGVAVERVEHAGGHVTGVLLADGTRVPADAVVSNADVLTTHELVGRSKPRRPLKPTMSCFLLYLGTDRQFPQLLHHTLFVGPEYKRFIADVTRRGRIPSTLSTYVHAPSRTEPGMAVDGGDSICVLLPVPNLRGTVDWSKESDRLRDAVIDDYEHTYGLSGLRDSIVVEHRMTPEDFRDDLRAVDGNAFALEPTLHQSAAFRPPNRDPRLQGLYLVGGGTHPGAGIPGVLLGAEVTTGLIAQDVAAHRLPSAGRRTARAVEKPRASAGA